MDPEIIKSLKRHTTCDVSDALLKLKHPHGGFLPGISLWSPKSQEGDTRIAGPAYTVKYIPRDLDVEIKFSGHYIDNIPPGAVVFISSPKGTVNAVYGGLMSNRAKYSGAAGTVVDGRIRDLQEHRDLDYPVFARSIGTAAPYEAVKVSEVNVPVRLQLDLIDVTITPGDYIIGDLNGVVCLPKALAKQVCELIPSQVEADERIAADIQKGVPFAQASRVHRAAVKQP